MIKKDFPFLQKILDFDVLNHEYILNGEKVISVTRWLESFNTKPFDSHKISEEVSKNRFSEYYGMNPEKIRLLWSQTAQRGSEKHNSIEEWLLGKSKYCEEKEFLTSLNITPKNSWSEIPLGSEKLKIAGTADIIQKVSDNWYRIWDIKTFTKISDNKIDKASLQILLYCILLYQISNKTIKVTPGGIILIQPKNKISNGAENIFNKPELLKINLSMQKKLNTMIKQRYEYLKKQTT